jgi:hypothetical protein
VPPIVVEPVFVNIPAFKSDSELGDDDPKGEIIGFQAARA